MSTKSSNLTIRFRHPQSGDAPGDPDSPCVEAQLEGGGTVSGGQIGKFDEDGMYTGQDNTPAEARLGVRIDAELNGAISTISRSGGSSGQPSASLSIRFGFGPEDAYHSLCQQWITELCWVAKPWIWPNLAVTDFAHEGEGYETSGGLPVIVAGIRDGQGVLDAGFELRLSWPRGDLRPFLTHSNYYPLITWQPFRLNESPEPWVAGPLMKGGDDAYRVPVKFVLVSEGAEYALGDEADFTSEDLAFKPQSSEGGAINLNGSDEDEDSELNTAFNVTQAAITAAVEEGWNGQPGTIEMICYDAWGQCEFSMNGWCKKPDQVPGDDDDDDDDEAPENPGYEVITNPRVTRFETRSSPMDGEIARVTVAMVSPIDKVILKVSWGAGGADLDIRARFTEPFQGPPNAMGWCRDNGYQDIAIWTSGDNTDEEGSEWITIYPLKIADQHEVTAFELEVKAFWYDRRDSGDIDVTAMSFRGDSLHEVIKIKTNAETENDGFSAGHEEDTDGEDCDIEGDVICTLSFSGTELSLT